MQLPLTANSLTLNTYSSNNTAGKHQPAVSGTALPASLSSPSLLIPATLQTSPIKPVDAPAAGGSAEFYTDEQPLSRDGRNASSVTDSDTKDPQNTDPQNNEQQLLRELSARDREVRQHELSHAAAGGQYAGAPTFEYQRGPDGRLYAVGGEVSIDTSPVPNDPEATLEKAEVILRAALAVADPSPQDRAIAARAAAMAAEARAELGQQRQASDQNSGDQREADQMREARRSEEQQQRIKDQQEQGDSQSEKLQEFSKQLEEVNQKFAEINQRLIDAGVFKKLFAEGFIFDERV
ncbi:putative metalloprotease CJM1_0395 family protein [Amphritea sp.]|uniref:putative metalloprotease CJM1_0395 family protein n=1 Tax=Amphritea sp. TaxID=1872502 RepID=UPI003D101CBF